MDREPKIIGTELLHGILTIDDFRQLFKRLITDYKKLTVEQKKYEVQKKIAYPGKWYEKSGRVLVEYDNTKLELIKEISLKIKEIRN